MLKIIKTQPKMLLHSSFEWRHKGKEKKKGKEAEPGNGLHSSLGLFDLYGKEGCI